MVRHRLLAMALLAAGAGCTLIVGKLSDCATSSDCASKGSGLVCLSGVCVDALAGGPGPDAGCVGAAGCYACAPSTFIQYLDACTDSSDICTPFDNSRVTLLFADGGLPAVPPVDAGAVVDAGPPLDAGPSVDAGAADAGPSLPSCVPNGNPVVYVTGSSAAQPFLAALGLALFNDTTDADGPLTVVYQSSGSCVGVGDVLNGDVMSGTASYWDPSSTTAGNQVNCLIPAPVIPDLGVSDVFPQTCVTLPNGLPASVGEFFGPVQTMTFVVPTASTQQSISAEAAYSVLGFGGASGVDPWTDEDVLYRRNPTSGTQSMIAAALGVDVNLFKGLDAASSSGVISRVTNSPDPAATLAILADTSITGTVGLSLRVLAFQHYGQDCGYLPDSNASSKDKRNVRDGHYAIWGPIHFLAEVDSAGYVRSASAKRVVDYVTGTTNPPGSLNLIQVEAVNNLVPTCAMEVTRTQEMGPYASAVQNNPCGCAFEQVATGTTTCTPCTSSTQCPSTASRCSYGYCEP